jgi:hypothetical protein
MYSLLPALGRHMACSRPLVSERGVGTAILVAMCVAATAMALATLLCLSVPHQGKGRKRDCKSPKIQFRASELGQEDLLIR